MRKRLLLTSGLLSGLLFAQCGALRQKVQVQPIWEGGTGYVRLVEEVGKSKGYDHPRAFHEEEMYQVLSSLYVTRYQYFHWTRERQVFEEENARRAARYFQQAFLDAGPDQYVDFFFRRKPPGFLGIASPETVTRGRAFVKDDGLFFQFDMVYQPVPSDKVGTLPEPEVGTATVSWKMVPQHGQSYVTKRNELGQTRNVDHWIRIDLARFFEPSGAEAAPVAGQETPPPADEAAETQEAATPAETGAPPVTDRSPEERLRSLKGMLDGGLITQQDYDRKKAEILDEL